LALDYGYFIVSESSFLLESSTKDWFSCSLSYFYNYR